MTRLSSHFRNKADDARVARIWSALDARFERAERRRPLRLQLLVLAACAAALSFVFVGRELGDARKGDALQVIELAEGSRVAHRARDPIEIAAVTPERVELRMTRGRAHFSVARNPKRTFLTRAGAYTIRVVGTEYEVDLKDSGVRVEVARGEVEVRRDGSADVWRVRPGEVWSSTSASERPAPSPVRAEPRPSAPAEPKESATKAATTDDSARSNAPPKPSVRSSPSAELFQRAQEARIAGRRDETTQLLSEFVRRFPNDSRTSLAAFELGRLQLEAGDAKGALEALDRAESAGVALREQVQARRVQALEQLGDLTGCRAARATFLARFPGGTFAEVVRQRCP